MAPEPNLSVYYGTSLELQLSWSIIFPILSFLNWGCPLSMGAAYTGAFMVVRRSLRQIKDSAEDRWK